MSNYEKALFGLFMQANVWCKPIPNEDYATTYWPEGDEGHRQLVGYLGGIAAMSSKPWHVVGGDYYRLLIEIDESLVDKHTLEILKDRPCIVSAELVEQAKRELAKRIK